MKAIETRYKGYRFRSRLEARWAVFFDEMQLDWEHEPEGFDFGYGIFYLPDFLVRLNLNRYFFVEIKRKNAFQPVLWKEFYGENNNENREPCLEEKKIASLAKYYPVDLIMGDPLDCNVFYYQNGRIVFSSGITRCVFGLENRYNQAATAARLKRF